MLIGRRFKIIFLLSLSLLILSPQIADSAITYIKAKKVSFKLYKDNSYKGTKTALYYKSRYYLPWSSLSPLGLNMTFNGRTAVVKSYLDASKISGNIFLNGNYFSKLNLVKVQGKKYILLDDLLKAQIINSHEWNNNANTISRNDQYVFLDHLTASRHSNYFYINRWLDSQKDGPFEDNIGIINCGIGMFSDEYSGSGTGYAEFNIDGKYSFFESDITLEKVWLGNHGSTRFILLADGEEIFNKNFSDNSSREHIRISIPDGTKVLRLQVDQIEGERGTHGAIWGNAILTP